MSAALWRANNKISPPGLNVPRCSNSIQYKGIVAQAYTGGACHEAHYGSRIAFHLVSHRVRCERANLHAIGYPDDLSRTPSNAERVWMQYGRNACRCDTGGDAN